MAPLLRSKARLQVEEGQCHSLVKFKAPGDLTADVGDASSKLLALPQERLSMCFLQAHVADRIMLAVSCKALLRASTLCHLEAPKPSAHRAFRHNGRVTASREDQCECGILQDILKRFRPRDKQGRLSRASNLCVDCAKYRPTRKGYWSSRLTQIDTASWGGTEGQLWQSAVSWFGAGIKVQCPECRMAEHQMEERNEAAAPMLAGQS